MPLRIISSRTSRSLTYRLRVDTAVRTTSSRHQFPKVASSAVTRRAISSKDRPLPKKDNPDQLGPNQEQLPHVSEEAAAQNRIEGKPAPEIEQGTPVQEVLAREKKARENPPESLKDEFGNIKQGKVESEYADSSSSTTIGTGKGGQHGTNGTRSYSTSARRMQDLEPSSSQSNQLPSDMIIRREIEPVVPASNLPPGLKFELPAVPLTKSDHKDHRYDPCITHLTMLLMREGKKSQAQSNMARILNHLRTSPPPAVNPQRPLLPGAPPPSHLPLNPSLYLQLAVDSVAPLLRLRNQKGLAGGGASVQIPVPLRLRQRRTTAFKWILEAAEKKTSRGSGKGQFAQKVADEIIAVVEGKSGVWEKRLGLHKLGTAARSNIGRMSARRGRSRRSIFSI